jgi:hypothetical protein
MGIAGGILLGVFLLIVVITVAMVKRGESAMHNSDRR